MCAIVCHWLIEGLYTFAVSCVTGSWHRHWKSQRQNFVSVGIDDKLVITSFKVDKNHIRQELNFVLWLFWAYAEISLSSYSIVELKIWNILDILEGISYWIIIIIIIIY